MKPVLISSSQIPIPPKKGGAIEKLLFGLYSGLRKQGIGVKIVSCCKNGDYDYIIIPSIKLSAPFSLVYEFFWGIKVAFSLRKEGPDIIHLNVPFNAVPILMLRKMLYPGSKTVYTSHNPSWTVPDSELGFFNRLVELVEAWTMKKADRVVAISKAMKKGFIEKAKIPEGKIEVIYNFVDTHKFTPKNGNSWKRVRGIKKMALFVGKLTDLKGVPNLIKAIPKVLEKHPDVVFVFVGGSYYGKSDNPYSKMVKEMGIEDHVIFTGSVSEDELVRIFSSADVFVLPTEREGLPLVILEALASGVPVVATSVSGIPEVVNESVGALLTSRDEATIASAVEDIVFKDFRKDARARAMQFSLDKISREWRKFYCKLSGCNEESKGDFE